MTDPFDHFLALVQGPPGLVSKQPHRLPVRRLKLVERHRDPLLTLRLFLCQAGDRSQCFAQTISKCLSSLSSHLLYGLIGPLLPGATRGLKRAIETLQHVLELC